jgi:hypothetical protein
VVGVLGSTSAWGQEKQREGGGGGGSGGGQRERAARHGPNRGVSRPLTHGPRPAAGGRERGEPWGRMGRPGKKRSGLRPDEQENF